MDPLRVLIIADDPLVRAALGMLLVEQSDCEVAGQLGGAGLLPADILRHEADVILLDAGWEPADLTLLADLTAAEADLPPVVVLVPGEVPAASVLGHGAAGILLRDVEPDRLFTALQAASQSLVVLDPELAGGLALKEPAPPDLSAQDLTPREMEVLHLLAEGLPNKAIAMRLSISEHTVKFHVNAILSKLNAQSRTDAVVRATRLGILSL
jgi:DNA-binding NarL/FixJ family response regulator